MAIAMRRASSLPGAMAVLLLLLFLHTPTCTTGTALIHGYKKNSSFRKNTYLSEWGLQSENGRRLLQTSNYIVYTTLEEDRSFGGAPKPGNTYTRGCQANYYCRY